MTCLGERQERDAVPKTRFLKIELYIRTQRLARHRHAAEGEDMPAGGAVGGKPLRPKLMHYIQNAGVGLIILLMLLAMKNDVVRIFAGG